MDKYIYIVNFMVKSNGVFCKAFSSAEKALDHIEARANAFINPAEINYGYYDREDALKTIEACVVLNLHVEGAGGYEVKKVPLL